MSSAVQNEKPPVIIHVSLECSLSVLMIKSGCCWTLALELKHTHHLDVGRLGLNAGYVSQCVLRPDVVIVTAL